MVGEAGSLSLGALGCARMEPLVREFLKDLGINVSYLLAGLGGGLVNAIRSKGGPWETVGTVTTGVCVAVWIGEPVAEIIHLPPGMICFLLGYGGVRSVEWIVSYGKMRLGIKGDVL